MNDKIKELLAVLDMSEQGQIHYLLNKGTLKMDTHRPSASLADLAFRLRDEVGAEKYFHGCCEVYEYILPKLPYAQQNMPFTEWFALYAKENHVIIAALISKELK